MKKSIFRPIQNDEDCSDIIGRWLVLLAVIVVFYICLMGGWSMYEQATTTSINDHYQWMRQLEADPEWKAEQERRHARHGKDNVIIYEPDREPYYYCGPEKKDKCKFR